MKGHTATVAMIIACIAAPVCLAQPVDLPIPAATTTEFPAGVTVAKVADGQVYTDPQGRTLYGMDMRTLIRHGPDPSRYCQNGCAEWEPLLAPAGSKPNIRYPQGFGGGGGGGGAARAQQAGTAAAAGPGQAAAGPGQAMPRPAAASEEFVQPQRAPDWTIINGPQGPQWVYKGWHMVFVRKGDRPASTEFDGSQEFTWNTLKFVPPVPKVEGPKNVAPVFVGGGYALADKDGRLLYSGSCGVECTKWTPLAGGLASRGVGEWKISRTADKPQWTYRGKPVFVSSGTDATQIPAGGEILRP